MSPKKSAPELPDNDREKVLSDDEKIELNDSVEQLNDELVEALEEADATSEESADIQAADQDETQAEEKPKDEDAAAADTAEKAGSIPDDPVIDEAIDDIIASDSDALLDAEDEAKNQEEIKSALPKAESKVGAFFKSLWKNPASRWGIIAGSTVLVLALALVPHSRYFILNTVRVRASLEVRVVDSGTLQPLKNVTVKAAGIETSTDSDGVAKLEKVRLGKTTLSIEKRAFAPLTRDVTVGWGSNPLGEFRAVAVGSQYTFYVKDFLSGNPIAKAEAVSGDGNASSDEDGKIVLTLDTQQMDDAAQVSVDISADNYRQETLNITVNNREDQSVEMVPARRHVFVSKRSGNYDVYTVDADGKNEQRILSGSGYERSDLALIPHPSDHFAAYVATRENTRNQSGYLLSTLYILDTSSGEPVKIDQSEQIQVVGWTGNGRLVYVKIAAGASGTDPKRHRLISFNNEDHSDSKELASSNSFNDVVMAEGRVYYAPSNVFQETSPAAYSVNADGSDSQKILDKEVHAILRTSYDKFYLSAGENWYQYTIGSPLASKSSAPTTQNSRIYLDNTDNKTSLWIDSRDGKGVLLSYDKVADEDKTLVELSGLRSPVYWLNEKYAVFRVADSRETADYVLNTEGGEPRKISDVTDTSGISRWFYY